MLPTLPGIQELVNMMHREASDEYFYSDMSAPNGVQCMHGHVNGSNSCQTVTRLTTPTVSAQSICNTRQSVHCETSGTPAESSQPTSRGPSPQPRETTRTRHELNTARLHDQPPSSDFTINPPEKSRPSQPVYTLLTSRTNKFHARPEVKVTELSNPTTVNSPPEAQPQQFVYTVITPRTLRPKPDLVSTRLNDPSKWTIHPLASNPTNVLTTSPKPVHTVLTLNNNYCYARPNRASSMLYQLLKQSVPSTTAHSMTSETEWKSCAPIPAVSTSNVSKTSCVVTREDHSSPAVPKSTLPISGLNPHQKFTYSFNSTNSHTREHKPVYTVQSTETPESRVQNKHQTRSKSVIKPNKKPINRVPRKPASRQVKGCVPECKASCDGSLSDVKVALEREALWKIFHDQGNEMMVSRQGRPMFPRLELKVSGLDPQEMYKIAVNFVCVDNYRYNFYSSLGVWNQKIEERHVPECEHSRCFEEPQSPASGQFWNGKLLEFEHLRLTNRPTEAKNMVYVPTMRKQRIQLLVTMLRCARCHDKHVRYIDIPLTEFIAVSSYYNMKITEMKIAHNPQAKMRAFPRKRKRKTRGCKSPDEVTSCQSDDSRPGSTTPEDDATPNALLATPIKSSESAHVTVFSNEILSTTTSTQLSSDLYTSSILTGTSSVPMFTTSPFVPPNIPASTSSSPLSTMSPFVPQDILSSSSSFQLPSISSQAILSTTAYPMEHCNIVYTCQTTKPTAHVQTDDDILKFIEIYLSPFSLSGKNENFDSSIFDELAVC